MPGGDQVAARLQAVRQRIERAARFRDPASVRILAVTKGQPLEVCQAALGAGLTMLGENRVHEALPKLAALGEAEWHLVGHLQSNKVRQAAGRFAVIQSVDSLRLVEAIHARSRAQRILIEVNVAREPQRSGVMPEEAVRLAGQAAALLPLRGFMALAPAPPADPRPAFRELRHLHAAAEQHLGRALPILSMGMSDDFEVAVQEGSTMVRLGRILFAASPI